MKTFEQIDRDDNSRYAKQTKKIMKRYERHTSKRDPETVTKKRFRGYTK